MQIINNYKRILKQAFGGTLAVVMLVATVVSAQAYTVSIDQPYINNTNKTAISFTLNGVGAGAPYTYSLTNGASVAGAGTTTLANQQVTGINATTLSDGTATLSTNVTAPPVVVSYLSPTTTAWIVPNGVTSVTLDIRAGGGGGGAGGMSDSGPGQAGMGGGLSSVTYLSVEKATAKGGRGGDGGHDDFDMTTTGGAGTGTTINSLTAASSIINGGGAGGPGGAPGDMYGGPGGSGLAGDKVTGTLVVASGNSISIVVGSGGARGVGPGGAGTIGTNGSITITYGGGSANIATSTVIKDTTAPTGGAMSINAGASTASSTSVTLNVTVPTDTATPIQMAYGNTASPTNWTTAATTIAHTLTAGDATKTVYMRFKDAAGNITSDVTDTIALDTTAPTGGAMSINAGASTASSTSVTLNVTVPTDTATPIQMAYGNTASPTNWTTAVTSVSHTLTAGDATKTVYMRFKDAAGNITSSDVTDTIILDTAAPTGGSFKINADAATASSTSVTLNVVLPTDASTPIQMAYGNTASPTNWTTAATTIAHTLTAGDATKTVYMSFKDAMGNITSADVTDTIILDTTAPTGGSFKINADAATASSTSVTLNVVLPTDASTPIQMAYGNTASPTNWTTAATTIAHTLTAGDATKTVYMRFKDAAGNITASDVTDTIVLDTTAPSRSISVNSAATYATSTSVILTIFGGDTGSGISQMAFSNDNITYSGFETYATSRSYELTAGDGSKTVYIKTRDNAGNVSAAGSDFITLDTAAPTVASFVATSAYVTSATVSLNMSASDTNGIANILLSNDGTSYTSTTYATTKSWTITSGDGVKTVYLKAVDNAGNTTDATSTTITLDTVNPTGVISIPVYSTSTATLTLSGTDTNGIASILLSNDGVTYSTTTYATTKAWPLSTGDGLKTVSLKYIDNAGNLSSIYTATTTVDSTAPTGTISINAGAAIASSTAVTLTLSGSDALSGMNQMQFSTDGITYSALEAYTTTKAYTLASAQGTSTVYVKFTDNAGNISSVYTDTIILDTAAPTIASFARASAYATSTTISLNMSASDSGTGIANILLSNDDISYTSTSYATTKSWTISSGDGAKTVYLKVVDNAGNTTTATTTSVALDTTNPTGTISIPVYSTSTATLTLSGSDANGVAQMQFSNEVGAYSTLEAYATTKAWPLSAGDGAKTVNVKFKDNAGNISSLYTATTTVDSTAPTGTISINAGASIASSTAVTLNISASDTLSGVSQMQFSDNGSSWSGAEVYATTKAYTLPTGDGTKTVYARYIDNAGNISTSTSDSILLDTSIPQLAADSLLINGSATLYQSNTPDVTLSLQNVTGQPTGETVYVQFSHNGTDWFGANTNGTLSANTWGTGFSSASATVSGLSWPWTLQSKSETIHVQIKDNIVDGVSSDTNQGTYNLAPVVSAVTASQQSDATVKIQYSIHDLDNTSATTALEYSTNGTSWNPLDTNVTGQLGAVTVGSSDTQFTATWDAKTTLAGSYNASVFVRASADDGELLNNTGRATSTAFAVDAKAPSITGLLINGSATAIEAETPAITLSIAGLTGYPTGESVFAQFSRDGGTTWYGYVAGTTTENSWGDSFTTSPDFAWTLAGRSETISLRLKDIYDNISNTVTNQAAYNIRPELDIISAVQATSTGSLVATFEVRDRDTFSNTVTPTYQYSLNGSTWSTIDPTQLSVTDTSGVSAETLAVSSAYTSYVATWNAKDQFPNALTNLSIKVTVDDAQPIKNVGTATSSSVIIDAKSPTLSATSLLINDSSDIAVSSSKDITLKLQNVTAYPAGELIEARFSRDGGVTWSDWSAPFASDAESLTAQSFPWTMAGRSETVTASIRDIFGNTSESTDENGAGYNLRPQIISGPIATQNTDSLSENFGKVIISYTVSDEDTAEDAIPGYITPTISYSNDGGSTWTDIASSSASLVLASGIDGMQPIGATDTILSAAWDAKSDLGSTYNQNMMVKLTIDDHEGIFNTNTATSSVFSVDTTNPTIVSATYNGLTQNLAFHFTDEAGFQYRVSNTGFTGTSTSEENATDGVWQDVDASVNSSMNWIVTSTSTSPVIYIQVRDSYGNLSEKNVVVPMAPSRVDFKDISTTENYNESITWPIYNSITGAQFKQYDLYRTADEGAFDKIGTSIMNARTGFFVDTDLSASSTYTYKVAVTDTDGDVSLYSASISDLPDGRGSSDSLPPIISAVTSPVVQSMWATIKWDTDEEADSTVDYGTTNTYGSIKSDDAMVKKHEVTLGNLLPNTSYFFKVTSKDSGNNSASDDNGSAGYLFTTPGGPIISNVSASSSDKTATVSWNTDKDSDSHIFYSKDRGFNGYSEVVGSLIGGPTSTVSYAHSLSLVDLDPGSTYYFYVQSTTAEGNASLDNNGGSYYTFQTSSDVYPPIISGIATPIRTSQSVVIFWKTNEPATSQVHYGDTASSTNTSSDYDSTLSIYHSVTVDNLAANTTYFYTVTSLDAAGNTAVSTTTTFVTAKEGEVKIITIGGGGAGAGQFATPPEVKDTVPPAITNLEVATTTAFSATITYETSEAAIDFIKYGKDTTYSDTVGHNDYDSTHTVVINGLRMGTEYHFQVQARDKAGNAVVSEDKTFKTKYISQASAELKTVENIQQYEQEVEQSIESILPGILPPFIEEAKVVDITENSATVSWRTNTKAYASVSYGTEEDFVKATTPSTVYTGEVADTNTKRSEHMLQLIGLKPNTKYHFKVKSFSLPQVVGEGKDMIFVTKAPKESIQVYDIKNDSAHVIWHTPAPTSFIVQYKNTKTGETSRKVDEEKKEHHELIIDHLNPGTTYEVSASGYNENNNFVESGDAITIKTLFDSIAPKIANFKVDGALVPGRTDRVQTVITWTTDEPSNSTVYYQEGAGAVAGEFANKSAQLDTFTSNHAIILSNLKPGTIYQMKIESVDAAGNKAAFGPRTIITPQKGESIFDVIFKNFEETFKFLRSAGQ